MWLKPRIEGILYFFKVVFQLENRF